MSEDRRTLLKVLTGVVGGCAALSIAGPGLRAVLAPLGKVTVSGSGEFVPVSLVDSVPADGTPLNVPVVLEAPRDAWTKLPSTTVGAVFLVRRGGRVAALSSLCPHLGCGIDYRAETKQFACPCHESSFALEGRVLSGPSPRAMDELETRVVDGRVEVRFMKFKTGTSAKEPV